MAAQTHLAFDLGAESGRALLGELDSGRLRVRELHRFPNGLLTLRGHQHWNIFRLFEQLLHALRLCADQGIKPASIGVDTWGVDFGLLDCQGNILGPPYSYRDDRTRGAMESFARKVPLERVYELTGIQLLPINTLFQLESMVREGSALLEAARDLLFIPDLLHYLLSGVKATEFSFATTSQLYNPTTKQWEPELLAALGLDRSLLQPIVQPGSVLGELSDDVAQQTAVGPLPLVAVATHDTGSAVVAAPTQGKGWAFISSGTWSLMGIESAQPLINEQTRAANLTNEGGVEGTFRVLKNVMGLWLIQRCRAAWGGADYAELTRAAREAAPLCSVIDPDHPSFLNPTDMPHAIRAFCRRSGQPVPETQPAMVRCVLESLALKYRLVLDQLRQATDEPIERIHVIGGGARNRLLCQLTADFTSLPLLAGPVEATAVGNLLMQARALGAIDSLAHLRGVVAESFEVKRYEPQPVAGLDEAYQRLQQLVGAQE
ncbi:MAG: rhamnulokinase family protein [Candidatus Alcyoniella australis]|nr:rhamnulokinase family protein [Candidatus Alcyoniella australis]